ncbi:MAG: rod shape-determining protein MreD [Candidatus Omnitrophica bacterium ADurb.Bin277]|nr:MAG: rod shape-determining protein MreD [Candidatus Omnitrophica bacterium ADurb.Bin277]
MHHLADLKVIFYFLFLAILDYSVLPAFRLGSVYPSFLYLFVCHAAFGWESKKTVPVAFWAGLLKDFLGGGVLGVQAGILVVFAILLDQVVRKIEREFPGIYFLLAFLFVFCCESLKLILGVFVGGLSGISPGHFGVIFLMALYTALLLPFFDVMTGSWFGRQVSSSRQYELFR